MTRNLYALLVGINEYDGRWQGLSTRESHIPPLQGCLNDIEGMQAYLQGRVDKDTFELHLCVLTNKQATRQGIIDGFRQHLAQAGKEDVALFYYAGYGSQAAVPEAFWPSAPDRMMKTLVCYDSRINDRIDGEHWDLADKELARLVAEVDKNGPHTAVVLDCGHLGARLQTDRSSSVATRQIMPDLRDRPKTSFIVSPAEAESLSLSSKNQHNSAAMQLPAGRHIVLSACAASEQAYEYYGSSEPQGTFSYFLQAALAQAKGTVSYKDLFKRANVLVRSSMPAQSPQMAATYAIDLQGPFLGGAIAPSPSYFTVSHHPVDGWIIDGGAIHGLVSPQGDETTTLALFPYHSPRSQMNRTEEAIAQAKITQVLPKFSKIQSSGLAEANPTDLFKAVVVRLPLPTASVFLEGEIAGTEALRRALAIAGSNNQPSDHVQATSQLHGASFRVKAANGTYAITEPTGDRLLTSPILGYDAADDVVKTLEHIAKWHAIAQFTHPATSQIQGAVELKIYTGIEAKKEAATEITAAQIRLTYQDDPGDQTQIPPRFRIKLHNKSNQPLYCALLYLTERFKSAAIKPDSVSSIVRLLPNQETWFAGGAPLNGRVPDSIWQQGITECQDILKLIACTEEFDPTLLNLGELGKLAHEEANLLSSATGDSCLTRLMQRVHQRHTGSMGEIATDDDWITNQVAFTFIRPQLSIPLSDRTSTIDSAIDSTINIGAASKATASVTVQSHPQLKAHVRLTTPAQAAQFVGSHTRSPLLPAEAAPFQFTQNRASAPGLSVLELSNLTNPHAVNPEQPLRLETDMPLGEDQYLFPTAYDGEFYVPLGYGKTQNGKTQIVIERLTAPIESSRSSRQTAKQTSKQTSKQTGEQGSIHVFFQQITARKISTTANLAINPTANDVEYPLLRAVQLETGSSSGHSEIVYSHSEKDIKASIAKAKTIALYIHGLFTDTATILSEVIATTADPSAPPHYDLILAFDYDTLNTSLDQNARLLKRRLESLGLGAGHRKKLHIVAHSIGGLLARWFIEQEAGDRIADHLIMLGTPNAGASWDQIKAGMTAAIAFAINNLSRHTAALGDLGSILKQLEAEGTAQGQIQPGSDFLGALANPSAPKSDPSEVSDILYTLVMGNTSLMPADDTAALRQRLLGRLGKIAELSFFNQPNDMAVLASSTIAVPKIQGLPPKLLPVACNHLEYFSHPASVSARLAAEAEALTESPTKVKNTAMRTSTSIDTVPKVAIAEATTASTAASAAISQAATPVTARAQTTQKPSSTENMPLSSPSSASSSPTESQKAESQKASRETSTQPLPPLLTQRSPAQSKRTAQLPMTPPEQPPHPPQPPANQPPPRQQPPNQSPILEPEPVYAPEREPSPEAGTSPLMWGWLLFTGVLALIVAIAWVQYLSESSDDTPQPSVVEPAQPALPTVPETPPIAPETQPEGASEAESET